MVVLHRVDLGWLHRIAVDILHVVPARDELVVLAYQLIILLYLRTVAIVQIALYYDISTARQGVGDGGIARNRRGTPNQVRERIPLGIGKLIAHFEVVIAEGIDRVTRHK